jgi:hypothetical protein
MGNCDSAAGNGAKIRKGDTVRCDLDMDAGTMSVTVAGVDQGVCFTGMAGMEIWPAVQFYSSGRTVRLLKLEGPLSASAAVVCACPLLFDRDCGSLVVSCVQAVKAKQYLCDLQESAAFVGSGALLGKAADLGYVHCFGRISCTVTPGGCVGMVARKCRLSVNLCCMGYPPILPQSLLTTPRYCVVVRVGAGLCVGGVSFVCGVGSGLCVCPLRTQQEVRQFLCDVCDQ